MAMKSESSSTVKLQEEGRVKVFGVFMDIKGGDTSGNTGRKAACERNKGSWTEKEHKKFLVGLKKLGKGRWNDIAKTFVTSRTSTQVASHAQKYFKRQAKDDKNKTRESIFDKTLTKAEFARQESLLSLTKKSSSAETSSQATNSQALALVTIPENPPQDAIPHHMAALQYPCLDVLPLAQLMPTGCSVPNYQGIPYVVGTPENVLFFPPPPVINFARPSYPYLPMM